MKNETKFQFQYYPSLCEYITHSTAYTHALYKGQNQTPNIHIPEESSRHLYFITTELFICNKLHSGTHDYELIVKHEPISNVMYNIYACFLLKSTEEEMPVGDGTIVDMLMNMPNNSFLENFDISSLVKNSSGSGSNYSYYVTKEKNIDVPCAVVVFPSIIFVNTKGRYDKQSVFSPFLIPSFQPTNEISSASAYKEGFTVAAGSTPSASQYYFDAENNNMLCELYNDPLIPNAEYVSLPIDNEGVKRFTLTLYASILSNIFILVFFGVVVTGIHILMVSYYPGSFLGLTCAFLFINTAFLTALITSMVYVFKYSYSEFYLIYIGSAWFFYYLVLFYTVKNNIFYDMVFSANSTVRHARSLLHSSSSLNTEVETLNFGLR